MTFSVKFFAGFWFLLAAVGAEAQSCVDALSPIENTLCHQADLLQLDADLNRLYLGLRSQVTIKGRAELLRQQRAWLAERNRDCATGDVACLSKHCKTRVDQLQALNATAEAGDKKLDDVTPVMVTGDWKATVVRDPTGAKAADQISISQSLSDAGLPAVGVVVRTAPGKLCLPMQPCRAMGWTRDHVANVDGGKAIGRVLELSPAKVVLLGSSGAKWSSYYLLVPQSDGTLWSVFALCGPKKSDCRNAVEVWTPASADAAIWPPS